MGEMEKERGGDDEEQEQGRTGHGEFWLDMNRARHQL